MADPTPDPDRELLEVIEKDLERLTAKRTELRTKFGIEKDDKGKGKEPGGTGAGDLAAEAQQLEADAKLWDQLSASGKLTEVFIRDQALFERIDRAKRLVGETKLFQKAPR